ncbi:MAG: colonic acid export protein Wza, partial [Mucilaginibacter sp.]|nr:colonic acid export protein Wza [Mucilaginibacter sp.]
MKHIKYFLFFSTFILFCISTAHLQAQSSSIPQNLSTINVNDLTDAQIRQYMSQASAAGLSDAQLMQQAQSRGMPDDQIQLLQKRVADIRSKDGTTGGSSGADTSVQQSRRLNYTADSDTVVRQRNLYASFRPKIFGADLFRNKNMKFEPNLKLATPLNYVVGPEDQLYISVYGKSVANWKLNVSPDGNINIPGVGILNVSGKTIEQATAAIRSKLRSNNYAIGQGTSAEVSLGNIRSIHVIITGQVMRPGTYTLPSLATVFNALYASGGPNDNGTFRQIAIIRNNRIIRHLDVYDFLTKGEEKDNIILQDQDIIQVPTYRTRVELGGEVKIPGLFEVLPGESLWDVIGFAGGFTDQAYTARISVIQISEQQKRITDVLESDYKSYTPLRGDKYIITRILERYTNRVTITGAVFRPGVYELQKGLTVSGLIANAAGLREDAFSGRGMITRLNGDNSKALLPFNVKEILNKTAPDIQLQREDSVSIVSIFDLRDKYRVTINGEVRKPGTFAYADSMTVSDLIVRAGGFAEGASARRIEVSRRVNNSDPSVKGSIIAQVFSVNVDQALAAGTANFILKPFDIVSVYGLPGYEKQRTVRVQGEVLYPGYYTIQKKNEKISDIIARAGGISASADVEGGTLKRSNIAILGVDKNKADTAELARERIDRLNRLKRNFKDSTRTVDSTLIQRNNYVGIDLKKILQQPGSSIDLLVEDGDEIRVPKEQQIVRVNGEVLYPSAVVYSNSKSFKSYVLNAGGFSPSALKRGAYVVYPNGTVRGTRKILWFNIHPDVRAGSEIYVPKKPAPRNNTMQEVL